MDQKNEEIHEEKQREEDAEAVLLKIGEVADFFQISVKAVRI